MPGPKKIPLTLNFDSAQELMSAYYTAERPLKLLILEALERQYPAFAREFHQRRRVAFENIGRLRGVDLQKVLREIDSQDLMRALQGASDELVDKVFQNISKRAALILREDMDFMGEVDTLDIEEAQERIARITAQLLECGMILPPEEVKKDAN